LTGVAEWQRICQRQFERSVSDSSTSPRHQDQIRPLARMEASFLWEISRDWTGLARRVKTAYGKPTPLRTPYLAIGGKSVMVGGKEMLVAKNGGGPPQSTRSWCLGRRALSLPFAVQMCCADFKVQRRSPSKEDLNQTRAGGGEKWFGYLPVEISMLTLVVWLLD